MAGVRASLTLYVYKKVCSLGQFEPRFCHRATYGEASPKRATSLTERVSSVKSEMRGGGFRSSWLPNELRTFSDRSTCCEKKSWLSETLDEFL
ncbi:hypothetical protein L2E82_19550 [Cichorium intybus]|uniref:Uncharacterized protein n=1 Tax=Cichorium intybus TaxID=13427 RepID=A0ACB9FC58_CICIN|nr:hypothetical protein L2E82_19550 [Cichorium intybus]